MKKFSYHQRLANLKLESLELRRLRADLLFTYKPIPTIPALFQKQH